MYLTFTKVLALTYWHTSASFDIGEACCLGCIKIHNFMKSISLREWLCSIGTKNMLCKFFHNRSIFRRASTCLNGDAWGWVAHLTSSVATDARRRANAIYYFRWASVNTSFHVFPRRVDKRSMTCAGIAANSGRRSDVH